MGHIKVVGQTPSYTYAAQKGKVILSSGYVGEMIDKLDNVSKDVKSLISDQVSEYRELTADRIAELFKDAPLEVMEAVQQLLDMIVSVI